VLQALQESQDLLEQQVLLVQQVQFLDLQASQVQLAQLVLQDRQVLHQLFQDLLVHQGQQVLQVLLVQAELQVQSVQQVNPDQQE
jgi:hypothetical protein